MSQQLFKDEAEENRGEQARVHTFIGAIYLGDLVKTTLGPKGMDKILQSVGGQAGVTVTNDGATILKAIMVDNAAAKILIDISRVQDEEVGDGTTSVCVLASELLREAERLVLMQVHPQTIIAGWREAVNEASKALQAVAIDNKNDIEKLRQDLLSIARTTLSSKILVQDKELFAKIAVDAVLRLGGSTNLDSIQILKKAGGSMSDSFLDEGFILDKKIAVGAPKRLENCKILIANTPMDTDKIKIFGARVKADNTNTVAEIEQAERSKMLAKCDKIIAHKGVNVFVNRQLIYNFPEQYLVEHGILSIEHADFDGIERLALVTNGEITSTFDHPELTRLGECKLIEEVIIGEDRMIRFSGVPHSAACTVVLRGPGQHVLDESERSLHDALCVLSQAVATDTRVIYGGGCAETLMAKAVDQLAAKTEGKKQLAIEAFARALRQIPAIIAENGGFDATELVSRLRAAHNQGHNTAGLDMTEGEIGDMAKLGITESFKVKHQVLISATEAAEMILRVDDVIKCAPRKREKDPHMGGM